MSSDIHPHLAANDHPHHVASDTVVSCDDTVRAARITADGPRLGSGELIPGVASLVTVLLLSRRPRAIFWAVWAVIITTLEGEFRVWSVTHIGKKVREHMPALTDFYPPRTVVLEPFVRWVIAAAQHLAPDEIFRVLFGSGHRSIVTGKGG